MIAKIFTAFAALATFGSLFGIVQLWRQQAARVAVRVPRYSPSAPPQAE